MTFAEVERAVNKLAPEIRDRGDRIFTVRCGGGHITGWTKVSRKKGTNKDLGHYIEAAIPKQLGIARALWTDIAGCTKGRTEYLAARAHEACVA